MTASPSHAPWNYQAALASWLVPGLGHLWLGHRRRGFILMATIYGLFLAGLLIGGLDVVATHETFLAGNRVLAKRKLWFFAQIMVGPPAILVDQARRPFQDNHPPTSDKPGTAYVRAVGRPYELGTLYCAMAGMLNVLVILDALLRPPARRSPPAPLRVPSGQLVTRSKQ